MKKFTHPFKHIGFIHYGGALLVLLLGIAAYVLMAPNYRGVLVTIRLAEKDIIWLDNGSPRAISADAIKVGMKEIDVFGRTTAEVVRVTSFDQPRTESPYTMKKAVYVTLRLRSSYNKSIDQYRYEGIILQVGDWVRFTVHSTVINGLIVRVPAQDANPYTWVTVKAQIKSEGPFIFESFAETTGVDKAIADAVVVGDMAKDSDGNILAEVLDKTVTPAMRTTWDIYGNVFNRPHPRKYDVILTLRLAVSKIGNDIYYLDSAPIKINSMVPLFLSRIDIEPRIIEIVSEQ